MTFEKTLLEQCNSVPPFVCYALARRKDVRKTRFTPVEIASRAGMSKRTFFRIAVMLSWDRVKLSDVEKFTQACGVSLLRQNQQRQYLRLTLKYKRPMAHLSPQQYKNFLRRCQKWKERQRAYEMAS